MLAASKELEKTILDGDLMNKDFEKYEKAVNDKTDKFNNIALKSSENQFELSFIIYLITSLKRIQTSLFKYGIENIKHKIKADKDIKSYFLKDGSNSKQILDSLEKNNKEFITYIQELVTRTSKNMDDTCEAINKRLESIEETSDYASVVFGDAIIKNKERNRRAKEFITIYHKDIAEFVKEYKLIGIEYDKRIKLVDKQEIFNRFFNKIYKTIEDSYKE